MAQAQSLSLLEEELQHFLVHIMERCEVLGKDEVGRHVLQMHVDDQTLTQLLVFGTKAACSRPDSTPGDARRRMVA